MTGDGLPKYDAYERAYQRELYPADGWQEYRKCESCDKPHPVEKLVHTLDGLNCFDCMEIYRSEAELDLAAAREQDKIPAFLAPEVREWGLRHIKFQLVFERPSEISARADAEGNENFDLVSRAAESHTPAGPWEAA